jgi:hypothetical protein
VASSFAFIVVAEFLAPGFIVHYLPLETVSC